MSNWIGDPLQEKAGGVKRKNKHKNGCTVNIVDNGRAQPHMNKT